MIVLDRLLVEAFEDELRSLIMRLSFLPQEGRQIRHCGEMYTDLLLGEQHRVSPFEIVTKDGVDRLGVKRGGRLRGDPDDERWKRLRRPSSNVFQLDVTGQRGTGLRIGAA